MGKKKANKRKGALAAHYDSVDLILKDVTLSLINFERHINDVRGCSSPHMFSLPCTWCR